MLPSLFSQRATIVAVLFSQRAMATSSSLSARWRRAPLNARRDLAIRSSLRARKGEGRKMPNWDRGIKKRRSGIRRKKVNLGSRCLLSDSQIIAIRYDTCIALQYRNDSRDSIKLVIHRYDMYRSPYDTYHIVQYVSRII
jgi:hypothetical protein